MTSAKISTAHWIANMATPLADMAAWLALVEKQLAAAAQEDGDILLLPEHISEMWMQWAPADAPEMAWVADQAAFALPHLQQAVKKTGVVLAAGSTAWRHEKTGKFRNRSWMLFPDREAVFHDKLVMTPSEQKTDGWAFEAGDAFNIFEWRGNRLALLICLDVEMPALAHLAAVCDIDLLLVPSMTARRSGYHRVFSCARARAVELMTAVAVVGCVGAGSKDGQAREGNNGGASVFVPSEEVFGDTGIFGEIDVHAIATNTGQVLYARDIPIGQIRRLRHGRIKNGLLKPEAWPGPWDATHIKVTDAGKA